MQAQPDMRRQRTMAAAAILLAGLTLGFTFGRMSVWLVGLDYSNGGRTAPEPARETQVSQRANPAPPAPAVSATPGPAPSETPPAAGPQANTAPPLAPPANPSPAAAAPEPGLPAPSGARAAAATAAPSQEPPKPVVAPNWRAASSDRTPSAAGNDAEAGAGPSLKLINPAASDPRAAAAEPAGKPDGNDTGVAETEIDRPGIAACEKRYSSFRRSDGTYQPYGGGRRQRCPLLR